MVESSDDTRMYLELGVNTAWLAGGFDSSTRLLRHCPVAVSHKRLIRKSKKWIANVSSIYGELGHGIGQEEG